jgi:hypothetical protein
VTPAADGQWIVSIAALLGGRRTRYLWLASDTAMSVTDRRARRWPLTHGWPIATGIVEGACRHLIKDRMDITGARWGLAGAEAILKLRAIKANGDFEDYWQYHLAQERHHVHEARYHNYTISAT